MVDTSHTLSVVRLFAASAITATAVFVLCWLGTLIPLSGPSHAYIGLFTTADASSAGALVEGTFWSLLFGGLVGAVFGLAYRVTGSFGGR